MSIYASKVGVWLEEVSNFGRFLHTFTTSTDPVVSLLGFEAHDEDLTDDVMAETRKWSNSRGEKLRPSLIFDPSWFKEASDPLRAAELLDEFVMELNPDHVLIDGEMEDAAWIRTFLWGKMVNGAVKRGIRGAGGVRKRAGGLRPGKAMDWTLMSFQDGNWQQLEPGDTILTDLGVAGMDRVLQPYGDKMQPYTERAATAYLVDRGVPFEFIRIMLDGDLLRAIEQTQIPIQYVASGWVFTAERWLG